MANPNNNAPLKITLEDIASAVVPEPVAVTPAAPSLGAKSYGTINQAAEQFVPVPEERGSILLQGWFYLGIAGLVGALAGWAIAEPGFVDGSTQRWGNFSSCHSSSRSCASASPWPKARWSGRPRKLFCAASSRFLWGFYSVSSSTSWPTSFTESACGFASRLGAQSYHNPAVWIARGIAWMVFGAAGGLVYGIIGQSAKKGYYGVIGGVIGAGLGGMVFDPIAIFTKGGAPSRAVGFALVGIATGVGMGLVESALKDRWFYVMAGPLAGKQFILYKSLTTIGSRQQSDIYLFKDPNILPEHAVIQIAGARVQLRANGPVLWAGQTVKTRVLQDGDLLQIGRYSFRYKEKHRS